MNDTMPYAAGHPRTLRANLAGDAGRRRCARARADLRHRPRTSALDAPVNGTASHALDYDDFWGVLGGHPSAP